MGSHQNQRPFTEEEDQLMAQCAKEDMSAAQCARKLGRTRNSIIGRSHRIGVQFHKHNVPSKRVVFKRENIIYKRMKRNAYKDLVYEPVTEEPKKVFARAPNKKITWGRFWNSRSNFNNH